jgi:hypothetical protein
MSDEITPETKAPSKPKPKKVAPQDLGVGLDIGTMNIVGARKGSKGIETRRIRDAFLDLPIESKKMLKLSGVSYVERDDELIIIGDPALETANIFGREARRPLQAGLISAGELDALDILGLLVKNVLGEPAVPGEACCFSVPAAPIDQPDKDVIYHKGVFERIVSECGFEPFASNEAMAIIYAETAKEGFSGVALSFGSGMTNIALAVNTIEGLSFSVARGGDWIDSGASRSVGSTQARICAIKEQGIDLNKPVGREQEAVVFYYKNLIEYALDQIAARFKQIEGQFTLPRPIPMVVSGGTSLAGGFMEFFTDVFERKRKKFPIEVSEIRHAKEPLNAVAYGLLVQAMQEHADED